MQNADKHKQSIWFRPLWGTGKKSKFSKLEAVLVAVAWMTVSSFLRHSEGGPRFSIVEAGLVGVLAGVAVVLVMRLLRRAFR